MRQSLRATRAPSTVTAVRLALACVCGLVLALMLAGAALADSMSLSVAPEPVQSSTSQITYSAWSEEGTYPVVAVNNPGVPCAASPQADTGKVVTALHFLEGGNIGEAGGSLNWTAPSTGAYTVCGWLTIPAGLLEMEGGPVVASASLPVNVRAPRISLALSFPRPVVRGRPFALDLVASSEVEREVVVVGLPYTRRGCPIDYAASTSQHLIDKTITGGPWLQRTIVRPLAAGRWIFCAWADPVNDGGLYPQGTASLVLHLGGSQHHAAQPKSHRRHR